MDNINLDSVHRDAQEKLLEQLCYDIDTMSSYTPNDLMWNSIQLHITFLQHCTTKISYGVQGHPFLMRILGSQDPVTLDRD